MTRDELVAAVQRIEERGRFSIGRVIVALLLLGVIAFCLLGFLSWSTSPEAAILRQNQGGR